MVVSCRVRSFIKTNLKQFTDNTVQQVYQLAISRPWRQAGLQLSGNEVINNQ